MQAKAAAVGDHDSLVVKWVMGGWKAMIGPGSSSVNLVWTLHVESFMRLFAVELLD